MKNNITICPNGHRYRHTAYVSCPTCLNNDMQSEQAILKKNIAKEELKKIMKRPLSMKICVCGKACSAYTEMCPACKKKKINFIPDHYCGKLMYTKEEAKRVVKRSKGKFQGSYYCTDCDAHHVTKQDQHPSRVAWFESHPKQFRNKHI